MRRIRTSTLRMYIRKIISESLIQEKYIKQVGNKAASGEKFDPEDVIGLFQMTIDSKLGDTASGDAVGPGWENLKAGLKKNAESYLETAKKYANRIVQLEIEKSKLSFENEDKEMEIDEKITRYRDELMKLAKALGNAHKAPKESEDYGSSLPPHILHSQGKHSESGITPDDTKGTFVGSKQRRNN